MKSLAKVAIRILAVSFIAKSLFSVQNILLSLYAVHQRQENIIGSTINYLFLLVPLIIWLLSGIALWFMAKPVSKIIVDKTDCDVDLNINSGNILKIAFIIIGMVLVVYSIPGLISGIYNFIIYKDIKVISNLIGNIVKILIGIWLLFGSSGIVNIIKKLGRAGIYNSENELKGHKENDE